MKGEFVTSCFSGKPGRVVCPMVVGALLASVLGGFSLPVAAERISGTYAQGATLSTSMLTPGDRSGHQMVQFVRLDTMSSANPDFNFQCTLFEQDDHVALTGTHHGSTDCVHKNGDRAFFSFEGKHKAITKPDGTWLEEVFDGTLRWTGGTGRFQNIKGQGTYKGGIKPDTGGSSTWQADVSY